MASIGCCFSCKTIWLTQATEHGTLCLTCETVMSHGRRQRSMLTYLGSAIG